MAIRIGTSGWVYKHWRSIFYPNDLHQQDWFAYYARKFDTVEINNSFYRLPAAETFDHWRKQAPAGFLYAVKASRYLTHMKKLKDPKAPLKRFITAAGRLDQTFGPVLYQLPPNWGVDLDRFERFLDALPQGHKHVVEFRDSSWLIEDVFKLMEQRRVAHCIHDLHCLQVPKRVTSPIAYVRFHGDPSHGGNYSRSVLRTWARRLDEWDRDKLDVFVYFNNDAGGYAIKNALTLKRIVANE